MADLPGPVQGVINISNVQGNYLEVPMAFTSGLNPIPLTQFDEIRMEIKESYNVNIKAFLVFTVGGGLTIPGSDNNILTFVLDESFWTSQVRNWVYDITFLNSSGERYTYIKGNIVNILTASKI
jgi:hypothetical protein